MHIQDMVGNKTWIFELKVIPECMGLYFHQQDIEKHFLFFRWMNISMKLTWSITAVLFVDFIGSLFIAHFVFVLYHNRIRFFVFIFFKIKVEDFQQQKRKKREIVTFTLFTHTPLKVIFCRYVYLYCRISFKFLNTPKQLFHMQ